MARRSEEESLRLSPADSGRVARIAVDAFGADAHIGDMAREDFLGCLSKTWIEKVGSSLRVLPRLRAKGTRADVVKQAFQRLPGMRRASSTWSAFSDADAQSA